MSSLLKIVDDLLECFLELLVELLGENLLVVALLGSEVGCDELVVKESHLVGSYDDGVCVEVLSIDGGDLVCVTYICINFN